MVTHEDKHPPQRSIGSRRLRRLCVAILAGAVSLGSGCAGLSDFKYESTQKARALGQLRQCGVPACEAYPHDYKLGFLDGFYTVSTGGPHCPPAVAPQRYWKPKRILEECDNRRHSYYSGWQDGAARASCFPDTHHLRLFETADCQVPKCQDGCCPSPGACASGDCGPSIAGGMIHGEWLDVPPAVTDEHAMYQNHGLVAPPSVVQDNPSGVAEMGGLPLPIPDVDRESGGEDADPPAATPDNAGMSAGDPLAPAGTAEPMDLGLESEGDAVIDPSDAPEMTPPPEPASASDLPAGTGTPQPGVPQPTPQQSGPPQQSGTLDVPPPPPVGTLDATPVPPANPASANPDSGATPGLKPQTLGGESSPTQQDGAGVKPMDAGSELVQAKGNPELSRETIQSLFGIPGDFDFKSSGPVSYQSFDPVRRVRHAADSVKVVDRPFKLGEKDSGTVKWVE